VLYFTDSHLATMVAVLAHSLRPVEEHLAVLRAIEGDEEPRLFDVTAGAREVLSARWATTVTIERDTEIVALGEPRAAAARE